MVILVMKNATSATVQDGYLKGRSEAVKEYTNSKIAELIDEHCHKELYRKILRLRFIDGLTYEQISGHKGEDENFDINRTPRQIANIISRESAKLDKYL